MATTARETPAAAATAEPNARRRPPRAVWLATLLFALVGTLWTVALPMFRAPDEAAHLDLVLYLADGNDYPAWDGRFLGQAIGVDDNRHLVDLNRRWPQPAAEDAPPRGERANVEERGGIAPDPNARAPGGTRPGHPYVDTRPGHPYIYNQMPQHPPLYYEAMATVLRVERALLPEIPSLDRELGLLRLANVKLLTPLPLLAWAAARRLGMDDRAGTVAALLPLGLPQLTHIGAAVNNDNLLTLLGGVLAVLLVGVARSRRSRRVDLAVGLAVGLALLTKAFAVVFVPAVVVAYALCISTDRRSRRQSVQGCATALTLGAALGGWWWIRNWIRDGQPSPTTESLTRSSRWRPSGFSASPIEFVSNLVGRMAESTLAWIGYGTPKFVFPAAVMIILTVAVVGAAIVAVRGASRGRSVGGLPRRVDLAAAVVPAALVVVFVTVRAWNLYVTYGRLAFMQGRYLFGTVVAPMAIIAFGVVRVLGARAVAIVVALVATLQVWMLTIVVRGAWSGSGLFGPVESALAWSPWPPLIVVAVAIAAVATAVVLARDALDDSRTPGQPDETGKPELAESPPTRETFVAVGDMR